MQYGFGWPVENVTVLICRVSVEAGVEMVGRSVTASREFPLTDSGRRKSSITEAENLRQLEFSLAM